MKKGLLEKQAQKVTSAKTATLGVFGNPSLTGGKMANPSAIVTVMKKSMPPMPSPKPVKVKKGR